MSTKTKKDGSYMSTSEVAAVLNVCRQTVSRLPIPRFKFGALVRYAAADVLQFIASHKS